VQYNPSQTLAERRREARVSANRRGMIKLGARGQELPCTVHDLTSRGAGLSVARTFGIPNTFTLAIDGEPMSRFCRVVWSESKKLGVAFE
jgi:hypothetical protein